MDKIEQITEILKAIGMPERQQSKLCALTILAMANLKPDSGWGAATNYWVRIHDVIQFVNDNYAVSYAENSRETFRKQAMHHFRTAAIIEDNGKATNSPDYKYRMTSEFLKVIKNQETNDEFDNKNKQLLSFINKHESLKSMYASKKVMGKMPVLINSKQFSFSPGDHNKLQKAIIEEFAPRFAPSSKCLYVGDTADKDMVKDVDALTRLGFNITLHDKMPDVVLYREAEDWLYFIEAVDSVGPMSPSRILEIKEMTKNVEAGKIFVTAFLSFDKYKKFAKELAWDTEVWIAESPDHMIHLNGDKFLGPR